MPAHHLVVVAAAILGGGQVLAAQRAAPAALAGRWELPGGKVEPGESEQDALLRECDEELGVVVALGARLGADVRIAAGAVLRAWTARVIVGTPRPIVHRALRWLGPDELYDVDWLDGDLPLVAELQALLRT